MAAEGSRSLICTALWYTVVARHNALMEAWLRIAAYGEIVATRDPHVKQFPQRKRAMGLPALHNRPPSTSSAGGHMPAHTNSAPLRHPPPHTRLGSAFYPPWHWLPGTPPI